MCHRETEIETELSAKRPFSPFRGSEFGTASVKLSSLKRDGAGVSPVAFRLFGRMARWYGMIRLRFTAGSGDASLLFSGLPFLPGRH